MFSLQTFESAIVTRLYIFAQTLVLILAYAYRVLPQVQRRKLFVIKRLLQLIIYFPSQDT